MFKIIKNALEITWKNQVIAWFFVLYMIVITIVIPKLMFMPTILMILVLIAILLFTASFLSGWWNIISVAIKNSYKPNQTLEEKIKDAYDLKNKFLEPIPKYLFPVLLGVIIYYILFLLIVKLETIIGNNFIGNLDFIINDTKNFTSNEAIIGYIKNLPQEKLLLILAWQALFILSTFLFSMFTIFWPASLYFNKNHSRNIFIAYLNAVKVIFKKPLKVLGFNLFLSFLFFIFAQLASLSTFNVVFSFIYMVFMIYFFVFVNVLIFNYYGKTFENIGNNRTDSFGQE